MGWFSRNEHDEEQLSAYLDGELDSRHAEIVGSHLTSCAACAALLEELRGTRALLSALPAHTPGRSFVLGAEYARAPVRDAPPSRRFSLALVPAVALSVFVALLFVDLAGNQSGSSDESATLTTASSREADGTSAGAGSVGAPSAPPALESANSTFEADASAGKSEDEDQPGASGSAQDAGAAAGAAEVGPALRSSGPEATPAEGEAAITAADEAPVEEPSPAPLAFEAPEDDAGDGVSTLRILQVLAVAAFLASGFYVFVWPRVSRGGS